MNKTMTAGQTATESKKRYYYNVVEGVCPANHDVKTIFDYVEDDNGSHRLAATRLEVSNPNTLAEYLEDPTGHYVEHAKDWHHAHDYLIDLVQAMAVEIADEAQHYRAEVITSVIVEEYADCEISYCVDYDVKKRKIDLSVITYDKKAQRVVADKEELAQMLDISPEDFD